MELDSTGELMRINCTGEFSPYGPSDTSDCDLCPYYYDCEQELLKEV